MIYIYSEVNKKKLLHSINRVADFRERNDLVDPQYFIQVASLSYEKGKTFRPHMHLWREINYKEIIALVSFVI
jgi:hypothetical protein